jgi:hypothetical protein
VLSVLVFCEWFFEEVFWVDMETIKVQSPLQVRV